MWKFSGMRDWIGLMKDRNSDLAQMYYAMLKRIREEEFNFDVIVCWGENAAVKAYAEDNGIQQIYLELASMRAPFPSALLMDPQGVNGSASTTDLSVLALEEVMNALPAPMIPVCLNEELSPGKQSSVLPQERYRAISTELRDFMGRPGPLALVPLQLADDANQLIYSDFADVESFAEAAIEPLLAAGFKIILKGHPSAAQRGGYVMNTQRRCLKRYADNGQVLTLDASAAATDYLPMLDAADIVVTNNSSVGFEAMLMGRMSVVLGRACYAPDGALPSLEIAIRSLSDMDLRIHYLDRSRLVTTYMLACSFPLVRNAGAALIRRARVWGRMDGQSAGNPDWVRMMVEQFAWTNWSQVDLLRAVTSRISVARAME